MLLLILLFIYTYLKVHYYLIIYYWFHSMNTCFILELSSARTLATSEKYIIAMFLEFSLKIYIIQRI